MRPAVAVVMALATLWGPQLSAQQPTAPAGARTQRPSTAILGDTIRVGDVVPVAVRTTVAAGQRVLWPDTLPLTDDELENAAQVRVQTDTLPDGRLQITGVYAVTPWRPGAAALPELPLRIAAAGEVVETRTATLPAMDVVSVLPADSTGIEPRPAKGVLGPNWALWPLLLGLLLLIALIAGAIWWLRRRRSLAPAAPAIAAVSPRQRALEVLTEAREAGLVEQGRTKEFYTAITAAVREYLAALDPEWSEDLTTSEVLARLRSGLDTGEASRLADLLRPADQVKFARREPDSTTAHREWQQAVQWVQSFSGPPRPEPVTEPEPSQGRAA